MENEMEKVLLCTINDNEHLGQILSTYALHVTLQNLGYCPVVFDDLCRMNTVISKYIKERCCLFSDMCIHNSKEKYLDTFNYLLTGAEKKWKYTEKESTDQCFLNFGKEDARKIAYAPSFGKRCDIPLGPKNAAIFALKRFDGISVEDNSTLRILNMEFGIDAEKVCSPLFLVEDYPHFDREEIEGLFLSVFFEDRDNQKQKVVEMSEEILQYRIIDLSKDIENHLDSSIDVFLNALEKGALIITDSIAFAHMAVVYKKPFIFITSRLGDAAGTLSGLESLGLMERVIYTEDDVCEKKYLCRKPIRYGLVDYKLMELRSKSIRWLEEKLKKE